jgi:hypothetical protein
MLGLSPSLLPASILPIRMFVTRASGRSGYWGAPETREKAPRLLIPHNLSAFGIVKLQPLDIVFVLHTASQLDHVAVGIAHEHRHMAVFPKCDWALGDGDIVFRQTIDGRLPTLRILILHFVLCKMIPAAFI